jgi:hypothetical protein
MTCSTNPAGEKIRNDPSEYLLKEYDKTQYVWGVTIRPFFELIQECDGLSPDAASWPEPYRDNDLDHPYVWFPHVDSSIRLLK